MVWKPHVTVAAVAERDGRFLFVEEQARGAIVVNQPAGHLDEGESLAEAVVRETLEETSFEFEPRGIVGLHLWQHPENGETFLRVNFSGICVRQHVGRNLDHGIIRAMWMTREELIAQSHRLRSPMVLRSVDDFLAGKRYPLELLAHLTETLHATSALG